MRARRFYALAVVLAAAGSAAPAGSPPKKAGSIKTAPVTKKEVYELPKSGVSIARTEGGWLNVEGNGTQIVVRFFDKDKKPIAPDVERGLARFNYAAKNDTRAPLHREGNTLVTPATVRPPHNFQIILSLFKGEAGESAEVYTFKYP